MLGDGEIASLVTRLGVEPQRTGGVLLVDDERPNITVLRGFLEDHYTVHEAASGPQGLEIAGRVPLDVVVADQRMPEMTGVEMLAELKRRRPDIAGIVLTGFADMPALESAINRAGAFRFLRKPWEPDQILEAIEQATDHVVQRRTIERLVSLLSARSDELKDSLDQVRSQQEMLLHLERLGTIGKLTSGITHDLRNLMVAFRAAEWEIETAKVPGPLGEIVQVGLAGVDNMVRTLQTLHEYSRTGAFSLELAEIDPAVVVTDAMAIGRLDPAFKLHRVTLDQAVDLPRIRGDRQKLVQVLVNLLRNALHATQPADAVRVLAFRRDGGCVVAVEDDGPGVPPEIRERLFQPFASSKGEKGLGLGLYMARLIVESHGGRIGLAERPRGARFEVFLPAGTGGGG